MDDLERRIRGAEGEWYFRRMVSQDLPTLATDAMVAGWDGQSLRVLAGEPSNAYDLDMGDLFAKAMLELGRPQPSHGEAFRMFVAYLAWLIATERVSVLDGTQRIERIPWYDAPELDGLGNLAVIADEWAGGWGRSESALHADAMQAARELLAQLDG